MVSNKTLISEALRRDREMVGRSGLLSQLADALQAAEVDLTLMSGVVSDLSLEVSRLKEENSRLGTELQNWELGGGYL